MADPAPAQVASPSAQRNHLAKAWPWASGPRTGAWGGAAALGGGELLPFHCDHSHGTWETWTHRSLILTLLSLEAMNFPLTTHCAAPHRVRHEVLLLSLNSENFTIFHCDSLL